MFTHLLRRGTESPEKSMGRHFGRTVHIFANLRILVHYGVKLMSKSDGVVDVAKLNDE